MFYQLFHAAYSYLLCSEGEQTRFAAKNFVFHLSFCLFIRNFATEVANFFDKRSGQARILSLGMKKEYDSF
ncbi:MAG: hypothetical protein IJ253_02010, partial [Bacteroidaceae bacterium]|nr:hypothetical protein [Bacteroidaceae bacterium]